MSRHLDERTLYDRAEGALAGRALVAVEEHLDACEECRSRLEETRALLASLARLPREAAPARELWSGIAARIGTGDEPDVTVIPLDENPPGLRHRISLSVGQLLAAGIALAIFTGAGVWATVSASGGAGVAEQATPADAATAVSAAALADYDQAAADLREILEEGKALLDPATVGVLEDNLATIEAAITETREALERDPASEMLNQLLADNLRRRLNVLRHATSVIFAAT